MKKKYPTCRMGWHNWFAKVYCQTGRETAAAMALWFYLNHLAFGDRSYSPSKESQA